MKLHLNNNILGMYSVLEAVKIQIAMKKGQNLQKPHKQTLVINKRKYWYRNYIEVCVLCGKETHNRERVYNENEKGTCWRDSACWGHF